MIVCVDPAQVDWSGPGRPPPGCRSPPLGEAGGDRLVVDGIVDVDVAEATEAWRTALPRALGLGVAGGRAGAARPAVCRRAPAGAG